MSQIAVKVNSYDSIPQALNLSSTTNRVSSVDWKIERLEATFQSLNIAMNKLFTAEKYQPLLQKIESSQKLKVNDEKIKKIAGLIRKNLRTDRKRLNDKNYYHDLHKSYHQDFFNLIRAFLKGDVYQKFLKSENSTDSSCSFVQELTGLLYTSVDLEASNHRLVKNMMGDSQYFELPLADYLRSFPAMHRNVSDFSRLQDCLYPGGYPFSNQFNRRFMCNPNTQNNPIHKIGEVRVQTKTGEKVIESLAFGSQTQSYFFRNAEVTPEFQYGFLEDYRQKGKRHLYIFHQNFSPVFRKMKENSSVFFINLIIRIFNAIGNFFYWTPIFNLPLKIIEKLTDNESAFGDPLVDLTKEEKMKDTFFFMALAKDSLFYQQLGEFASVSNSDKFIAEIYRQFFDLERYESGIYFSPNMIEYYGGKSKFRTDFEGIVKAIHEELFSKQETLSVEERKNFISVLYINLNRHVLSNPGGSCLIDSFNTSCRDDIDRGMSEDAVLQADIAFKQSQFDESQFKRNLPKTFFARAMLVASRPIMQFRLDRAIKTIQFLAERLSRLGPLNSRLMKETRLCSKI